MVGRLTNGRGGFAGFADISEVRVYSRRLGDEEVAQRYEETCARYHACS